ncbi:MAG: hypothetical protein P8X89_06555 [Reinekea sp.]
MFPKNRGEPMGAPAIFEKQIEIKLLHPASTLESRIQAKPSFSQVGLDESLSVLLRLVLQNRFC